MQLIIYAIRHINVLKECYLSGQKNNMQMFGAIHFIKLQNDNLTVKRWGKKILKKKKIKNELEI